MDISHRLSAHPSAPFSVPSPVRTIWLLFGLALLGTASCKTSAPAGHENEDPGEMGLGSAPGDTDLDEPIVERVVASMGTLATLRIWSGGASGEALDRPAALLASESAMEALEETEQRLSTWIPESELSRVNQSIPGTPVLLSPASMHELRRAGVLMERTDGAFDPGLGALIDAWNLRGEGREPSEAEIADLLLDARFSKLEFKEDAVVRWDERLRLDAGAFGKGAGLEHGLQALRDQGVTRASLDLGGQVAFLDDEAGYEVGLADPRERGHIVLSLNLDHGSLATTGNSEHGRSVNGTLIGHVLDPHTGRPAHEGDLSLTYSSVSVWAPKALDADAYSTALFVLGPDCGLALADKIEGLEALYLIPSTPTEEVSADDASGLQMRATAGFESHLRLIEPGLSISFH